MVVSKSTLDSRLKSHGVLHDVQHSFYGSSLTCSTSLPDCNKPATGDVLSLISSSLSTNLQAPSTFTIAINILKAQIIQYKHRIRSLEVENEDLRHANGVYLSDMSSLHEELRKLRSDYYQELDQRRRRDEALKNDTDLLKSRLAEADVFIQAMIDLKLEEPVVNEALQAINAGAGVEEAFVKSIMAASTRQGSIWSRIVPTVVGPRSAEQYLSSVYLNLKARKEFYDREIAAPKSDSVVGPSPLQLSDICAEILGEMSLLGLSSTEDVRSFSVPKDDSLHLAERATCPDSKTTSNDDLDIDVSMDVNLPCTKLEPLHTSQEHADQPKDSDDEALADRLESLKRSQLSQSQSVSPPSTSPSLRNSSKKTFKASPPNKSPVTPSRPRTNARKMDVIETPRPRAQTSSGPNTSDSPRKLSSRRPTPKCLPSSSPIRSRLSTPRTNTFKKPSPSKVLPSAARSANKENPTRATGAAARPLASPKPILKDMKKRRGVIMVRKDSISIPASKTKAISATCETATRSPDSGPASQSRSESTKAGGLSDKRSNTMVGVGGRVYNKIMDDSPNIAHMPFKESKAPAEIVPAAPTPTAIARLVEAFSDSDLGSLELSDCDDFNSQEHIRLVFQGNAREIPGGTSFFPCIGQTVVEEPDVLEAVTEELVGLTDGAPQSPCTSCDLTPVASSFAPRRLSRSDTPTPATRSLLLLSGTGSQGRDELTRSATAACPKLPLDAFIQDSDRSGSNSDVFLSNIPPDDSKSLSFTSPASEEVSLKNVKLSFGTSAVLIALKESRPALDHQIVISTSDTSIEAEIRTVCIPKKTGSSPCISLSSTRSTLESKWHSYPAQPHLSFESEPPAIDQVIVISASASAVPEEPSNDQVNEVPNDSMAPLSPVRPTKPTQQTVESMSSLPATPPRVRAGSLTESGSPSRITPKARSNTIDLYLPTPQSPLSRLLTDVSAERKARSRTGSVASRARPQPPMRFSREHPAVSKQISKEKTNLSSPVLPLRITKKSLTNKSKPPYVAAHSQSPSYSAPSPLDSVVLVARTQKVASTAVSLIPNWTTTPTKNGALSPLQSRKLFNNSMSMGFR